MQKRKLELIIPNEQEITPELIDSLKVGDLRVVAEELFELKDHSSLNKNQLKEKLKEILKENVEVDIDQQNREKIKQFVSNLENRKQAIYIVSQIRETVGRTWFTVHDLHLHFKQVRQSNVRALENIIANGSSQEVRKKAEDDLKQLTQLPVETPQELVSRMATLSLFGLVRIRVDHKGKRPSEYRLNQHIIDKQLLVLKEIQENAE